MSSYTAVTPQDCHHCFCYQNTGGNWVCCKCSLVLRARVWKIFYPISYPSPIVYQCKEVAGWR